MFDRLHLWHLSQIIEINEQTTLDGIKIALQIAPFVHHQLQYGPSQKGDIFKWPPVDAFFNSFDQTIRQHLNQFIYRLVSNSYRILIRLQSSNGRI